MFVGVLGCAHPHNHAMSWLQCREGGGGGAIETKGWMREWRWVVFSEVEGNSAVVLVSWILFIVVIRTILASTMGRGQ